MLWYLLVLLSTIRSYVVNLKMACPNVFEIRIMWLGVWRRRWEGLICKYEGLVCNYFCEGVHGKLDKWKVETLDYKKPSLPPHLGHHLVIFSAAHGQKLVTQITLTNSSLKVLERSGSKTKLKWGLGMVFEGDFLRVSCLLILVYVFPIWGMF